MAFLLHDFIAGRWRRIVRSEWRMGKKPGFYPPSAISPFATRRSAIPNSLALAAAL
jgi:hypothetical protein